MRNDGRNYDELRKVTFTRNYIMHPEGSVLVEFGNTKVICNATIDESVPPFLKGTGKGWITAEYSMLPRATSTRNNRDISKLKQNARSVEIQRLIGRALRMAVDLDKLGERSIIVDCDVIQADGGTRTASISGGFIALYDALQTLVTNGLLTELPVKKFIAAISVGVVNGVPMLDLNYDEDSNADVDMNIIMDEFGEFAELQGTGENDTFSADTLMKMLEYGKKGNLEIIEKQKLSLLS